MPVQFYELHPLVLEIPKDLNILFWFNATGDTYDFNIKGRGKRIT